MNMSELNKRAKKMGVKVFGRKKVDIIRDIQIKEENFPCFRTAKDYCDQFDCLWRSDCLK